MKRKKLYQLANLLATDFALKECTGLGWSLLKEQSMLGYCWRFSFSSLKELQASAEQKFNMNLLHKKHLKSHIKVLILRLIWEKKLKLLNLRLRQMIFQIELLPFNQKSNDLKEEKMNLKNQLKNQMIQRIKMKQKI